MDAYSQSRPAQTQTQARAQNVVQAVRRWYANHPPEWRKRAASCLHYLDEAEAHHNKGQQYFVDASRAKSNDEETRLTRLGNEEIAERTRLIREFWACTRRMNSGDEFHSQGPPQDTPPQNKPTDDPPDDWGLPPGFPLPPAEARPSTRPTPPTRGSNAPVIVALGDITADARRRLAAALGPNPRIVIVALGLNDVKTRPPRTVAQIKSDLAAIWRRSITSP